MLLITLLIIGVILFFVINSLLNKLEARKIAFMMVRNHRERIHKLNEKKRKNV